MDHMACAVADQQDPQVRLLPQVTVVLVVVVLDTPAVMAGLGEHPDLLLMVVVVALVVRRLAEHLMLLGKVLELVTGALANVNLQNI